VGDQDFPGKSSASAYGDFLREALERIPPADILRRLFIGAQFQKPQQVAAVILVVELRANPAGQAFHREQVRRLGHQDTQVLKLNERREMPWPA